MPVTAVPIAKVLASDMLTLALKLGLPNPLKAAPEVNKPTTSSRQQQDSSGSHDGHSVLIKLPPTTKGQKPGPSTSGPTTADGQPGPLMVAIHISTESDFAADIHQITLTAPEYSQPCQSTGSGGMEMQYDGAITITDFNGMYYYESGMLLPGYTNSSPYDHPLD